jgi:hypothetical protein
MPTSHCRFPDHHTGPSAGPPFVLLGAIGLTACIIGLWHSIVLILVCIALLAVLAGCVFLLIHSAHAEPYDAPERSQVRYTAEVGQPVTDARTAALEAENAALRRQLEAPVVHNHLHLHGVGAEEVRQAIERR